MQNRKAVQCKEEESILTEGEWKDLGDAPIQSLFGAVVKNWLRVSNKKGNHIWMKFLKWQLLSTKIKYFDNVSQLGQWWMQRVDEVKCVWCLQTKHRWLFTTWLKMSLVKHTEVQSQCVISKKRTLSEGRKEVGSQSKKLDTILCGVHLLWKLAK